MLQWYSAPTVMHGIFWIVIGHSLVHFTAAFSHYGNAWYILRRIFYFIFFGVTPACVLLYGNVWYVLFYIFRGYSPRVRVVLRCQYVHRTRKSPDLELKYEIPGTPESTIKGSVQITGRHSKSTVVCVCVCFSSHLFWTSNSLDAPAGVTQAFLSTFLLRCVPLFFSRERFSRSFTSSTVKSN